MVFIRRFFIILFTGFATFIFLQIIYRKALGLDMITLKDFMDYFASLSLNDFHFGEALINFANSISDFSGFKWNSPDNFIDGLKNIFDLILAYFTYLFGIISAVFNLMYSVVYDLLVVVYFFRDFFGFLFT